MNAIPQPLTVRDRAGEPDRPPSDPARAVDRLIDEIQADERSREAAALERLKQRLFDLD